MGSLKVSFMVLIVVAVVVYHAEPVYSSCYGIKTCPSGTDACFKKWSADLTITTTDEVNDVWKTSYVSTGKFFFNWNLKRTLFNASRTLPDNSGDDPTWAHIIAQNEVILSFSHSLESILGWSYLVFSPS